MQDDEIEVESLNCAFCSKDLGFLTISEREAHYENHFLNDAVNSEASSKPYTTLKERTTPILIRLSTLAEAAAAFTSSSTTTYAYTLSANESKSPNRIWNFPKERDVFWYPEQTTSPPSNYTPGLIPLIKKGLLKGQSRQLIRRAVLCNQKAIHIHREAWDASWGCGYRNFTMACAILMSQGQQPLYLSLLDAPLPPGIRNLQSLIECAWKEGFDLEGRAQLKKLVGTSKWIGTADLWVAFSYHGIPVELVDFDLRKNHQGSQILIDWIVNYFSVQEITDASPKNAFEVMKIPQITVTEKMPIILQHDGHSRTIIGYEIDKKGVLSLLTFDPGFRPPAELRTAALTQFTQHRSSTQRLEGPASTSNHKQKLSDGDIVVFDVKNPRSQDKTRSSGPPPWKEGSTNLCAKNETKELDLYAMSRMFRLDTKNLSRKKQYQILYFPMTAPLTVYEKSRRKILTSTKFS